MMTQADGLDAAQEATPAPPPPSPVRRASAALSFGAASVIGGMLFAGLIIVTTLWVMIAFLNIVSLAERSRDQVVPQVIEQQQRALMAADLGRVAEMILGARDRSRRAQALDEAERIAHRFAKVADPAVLSRLDAALNAVRRSAYRADVLDALQGAIESHLHGVDSLLPPLGGAATNADTYATQLLFESRHVLYEGASARSAAQVDRLGERFSILRGEMRRLSAGGPLPSTGGRAFTLDELQAFAVILDLRREQIGVTAEVESETAIARRLLADLASGLSADAAQKARDGAGAIVGEAWSGIRTSTIALTVAVFITAAAVIMLLSQVVGPILRASSALEAMGRGQRSIRLPPTRLRELDAISRSVERLATVLNEVKVKESTAQKARHNLQYVFDVSPVPLLVERLEDSVVLDANRAACALLGLDRAQLVGRLGKDFWVVPGRRDDITAHLKDQGQLDDSEAHLIDAAGADFWALLSSRLIELDGAEVLLTGFYNITERKAYEARLHALVSELEGSNRDLEQFAYVASHDLQEPLRLISGYLQLLDRRYADRLDDQGREFIGFSVDAARRMQALVVGLLEYARVGGRAKPAAAVSCDAVVRQVADTLAFSLKDSQADLVIDGPLPTVRGDAGALERLFQNLLTNALRYRAPDRLPRIVITARADGPHWCFTVADNGIGIGPTDAERVFQLFHRVDPGKHAGTGIGLAICRKVVEMHGGRIWIDCDHGSGPQGEGCAFLFTLPAA